MCLNRPASNTLQCLRPMRNTSTSNSNLARYHRSSSHRRPRAMYRLCTICSRLRSGMYRCPCSATAALELRKQTGRKTAGDTATSSIRRLPNRNRSSDHPRFKRTAPDRSRRLRVRLSSNIARPCSSNRPLSSAFLRARRLRRASTVVLQYRIRRQSRGIILRSSYHGHRTII